jgi:hypothetical protein
MKQIECQTSEVASISKKRKIKEVDKGAEFSILQSETGNIATANTLFKHAYAHGHRTPPIPSADLTSKLILDDGADIDRLLECATSVPIDTYFQIEALNASLSETKKRSLEKSQREVKAAFARSVPVRVEHVLNYIYKRQDQLFSREFLFKLSLFKEA